MTNNRRYYLWKGILNIISGMSMVTLITLGVMYMSFDNAFVFHDIKIEVTNNPVTENQDIEFMMIGTKKHECNSTKVYGIAYSQSGSMYELNKFTKQYVHNTRAGESIPNQWSMSTPSTMVPGDYRVSMTGNFVCNYFIFQAKKSQTYDNILLVIK